MGFRTGIHERGDVKSHVPGTQPGPHHMRGQAGSAESLLNVVGGRQREVLSRVTTCPAVHFMNYN